MSEPSLILYGTPGCHLCDVAEALLKQFEAARGISWCYVDIALDDALVACYGEYIPVLATAQGSVLHWPFSLLDVLKLIQR